MKFKFPSAFTILFILIGVVAVLTWVIPAGEYQRAFNQALGKDAPVPGTFTLIEPKPQGFGDVLMAPIAGLYDPVSGTARAIDVSLFVLIIGGFLLVVTRTGAIDAGIGWLMKKLEGREIWMIPILMTAFAAGGTSYGMAEESLAFYALVIPVMIRAGYDSLTGVSVIMLGAGVGTMGSTFNAFATVIASNAASVPFTDGLLLRVSILALGLLTSIAFVMRYAMRVKADPRNSLLFDQRDADIAHFLKSAEGEVAVLPEMTRVRGLIMALFGLTFAVMLWGVISKGWWMGEMSALFLGMSIVVWVVGWMSTETRMSEGEFVDTFVNGARDLLGVALIIGVARGIVVVMDAGGITDSILHSLEGLFGGLGQIAFINTLLAVETILSVLVPSSSGLAVLTMPVLAPLGDFAGVDRSLIVTAYQSANGWVNLINPTFAVVMGGLAIGRVSYDRWLRFVWPLLLVLFVLISVCLSVGTLGSAPATPAAASVSQPGN